MREINSDRGPDLARDRIEREREAGSGFLDLGNLGLAAWPETLWDLNHLTCLNLGMGWSDEKGGFHFAEPGLPGAENQLPTAGARWEALPHLEILSFAGGRGSGNDWDDLAGLDALSRLRALDLSWTQIDDLTILGRLSSLRLLDCSYTFVTSLAPLAGHRELHYLDAARCRLVELPETLVHLPSLETLILHANPGLGIPEEVLSPPGARHCLPELRKWLAGKA